MCKNKITMISLTFILRSLLIIGTIVFYTVIVAVHVSGVDIRPTLSEAENEPTWIRNKYNNDADIVVKDFHGIKSIREDQDQFWIRRRQLQGTTCRRNRDCPVTSSSQQRQVCWNQKCYNPLDYQKCDTKDITNKKGIITQSIIVCNLEEICCSTTCGICSTNGICPSINEIDCSINSNQPTVAVSSSTPTPSSSLLSTIPCGTSSRRCPAQTHFCCNKSCGICAPYPYGRCTQQICKNPIADF